MCVRECVCVLMLPLQSEAELVCAGLDLVLGLQVVHALRGDAVNGQNDVADAHLGSGRLPTVRQLQKDQRKHAGPRQLARLHNSKGCFLGVFFF